MIVDAKSSRTELLKVLPELDEALSNLENMNDQYIATLEDADAVQRAYSYKADAEQQYQDTMTRIEQYLLERKDDPDSVVTQGSKTSQVSQASKIAEIALRVKEFELEQLKKRHERERKQEDLKRANEIEEAREARAAAELEAKLTLAAECELNWERRNDFTGENIAGDENHETSCQKELRRHHSVNHVPSPACGFDQQPATTAGQVTRPIDDGSSLLRNLPRLELTKFSGAPGEWPQWSSLFRTLVGNQPSLSETEKMAHLQGAVTGPAQKTISGMFYDGRLYQAAWKALEDRYGRQEDIVHSNMIAVLQCPSPTYLDSDSMDQFHAVLHSAVSVLQNLGYGDDLRSSENLRNVVKKLPSELKKEWGQYLIDLEPIRPTLMDLDEWLRRQVRVAINYAKVAPEEDKLGMTKKLGPGTTTLRRTTLNTEIKNYTSACVACGEHHRVDVCPMFLEKNVNERAEFVMASGICFYCLKPGHRARHCRIAKQCGIDGCRMRHHSLLHGSQRISQSVPLGGPDRGDQAGGMITTKVIAVAYSTDHVTTLLQVVRVKIMGELGRSKIVYALLDPGAQTSLCCEEVLRDLRITGDEQEIQLQTVKGCGTRQMSQRVQLSVAPIDGTHMQLISVPEVFSVPELHVKAPSIEKRMTSWAHVRGLNIAGYHGQNIELLLGANVIEAVLQKEVRVGKPGEPVAVRTVFGWALTGSLRNFVPGHMKQVMYVHEATEEQDIHKLEHKWWSTKSFGTKPGCKTPMATEDRRALKISREITKKTPVGILMRLIVGMLILMSHQVRMRQEDQPTLTLWRSCDTSRPPDDYYRTLATIFDARCSPSAASYVLLKTADEVLTTLLVEVESVLNCRPITYCSGDAKDPEPLTPRHFILGHPEVSLPPGMFDDSALLSRKRWRHTQVLTDHFWQRWRKEYLPTLMRREKWTQASENLQMGDVVLMVDDQAPRGYWPLATVTRAFAGEDGHVRSVELRTGSGLTYRRPVNKVCILERTE